MQRLHHYNLPRGHPSRLYQTQSQAGYTLVEMAIVLAIMGAIAGSALTLGSARHEASKIDITQQRMNTIEEAIKRHTLAAGYLPCPADPTALPGTAEYGIALDCGAAAPLSIATTGNSTDEVWIGAIPTRSLNLPDSYMYDGWQNRFSYAIIAELGFNPNNFNSFSTASTTGVIQILDYDNTQVTDATADTVVAYALVSNGKDAKGAVTRAGIMPKPCTNGTPNETKDDENCDDDAVFRDSRLTDSTTFANYYDDIVRWKTRTFLQPLSGEAALNNTTCVSVLFGGKNISGALNGDGTPYVWGNNGRGQFGNVAPPSTSPIPVLAHDSGSGYKYFDGDISTGGSGFTCGLRGDGSIWCSGEGSGGELGNGANADSSTPVREALAASNWTQLNIEQFHACAINSAGVMYCWGQQDATYPRLGDGTNSNQNSPQLLSGTGWSGIGLANHSSCGLRSGIAYCWGLNNSGQVGDGTNTTRSTPVLVVGGITDWTMLSGNNAHMCGLTSEGRAYCWGSGGNGRLGTGNATSVSTPTQIPGQYTDWTYISGGFDTSCGIRGGRMYCWGNSANYRIPNGNAPAGNLMTPVEAAGEYTDWAMVAPMPDSGGCAARANGNIYCWGLNDYGQVGDGAGTPTTTPTLVSGLNGCH